MNAMYRIAQALRPRPTVEEPPPAEIICVLDLIDFTAGPFGSGSLRGQARERELDKVAADLERRGEPYIRGGVRHPGANG